MRTEFRRNLNRMMYYYRGPIIKLLKQPRQLIGGSSCCPVRFINGATTMALRSSLSRFDRYMKLRNLRAAQRQIYLKYLIITYPCYLAFIPVSGPLHSSLQLPRLLSRVNGKAELRTV